MTRVLAIDPGNTHSGYALIDTETCQPINAGKTDNDQLRRLVYTWTLLGMYDRAAIEMIKSYGMSVGATVFDTCVWVGRYAEIVDAHTSTGAAELVPRLTVKLHHCGTGKAKDGNVIQALVDRFTPGQRNRGKGTKADPGWFHGFADDVWQAYALAVVLADQIEGREGVA